MASHRATHCQIHRTDGADLERPGGCPHLLHLSSPPSCWNEIRHSDHRHSQLYTGAPSTLRWRGALALSTRTSLPAPGVRLPPPGLTQAPPGPCPLGMLGVSQPRTEGPVEVRCAEPGDSHVFSPTALIFHVLEKFTSEASEEAKLIRQGEILSCFQTLIWKCLRVQREKGKS